MASSPLAIVQLHLDSS